MENFIGIDLGTTYSAVATIDSYGKPAILKNAEGEHLTPSVVAFESDGTPIAGAEAKELMTSGEDNVIMFFKRLMGDKMFEFNGLDATALSTILLRKLKADAELALGSCVNKAVITVPAYFNELQRNETVKAAADAGLEVLRIINEPTAAAIYYGLSKGGNQRILVYDLGGGTFDVTVLAINGGEIRVLATGGDHNLGGKDWDDCIINYVIDDFVKEFGTDPSDDSVVYNDLAFNAEKLKKQLTSMTTASMTVRFEGAHKKYQVSREMFERLTQHLMQRTEQLSAAVLEESGLGWHDLDGVLLVGGSTKMPMVERWVEQMSGKKPLRGINVDEAVCLGAAVQAAMEMERRAPKFGIGGDKPRPFGLTSGLNVKDVMSHSLGAIAVSADGERYVNSFIIRKNITIPATESRQFKFRTSPSNNMMEIYLTQGESTEVRNVKLVGYYQIVNIAHIGDGNTLIEVEYAYDENGMIRVRAYQKETGRELEVVKMPIPDPLDWLYQKPKRSAAPMDIILAMDVSGSMHGNPLTAAINAAKVFVHKLDLTESRISVVGFSDRVTDYIIRSHDKDKVTKAILKMYTCGGTESPLKWCYNMLEDSPLKRVIVVLTDGEWFAPHSAIWQAKKCHAAGIDIISIGVGNANEEFLRKISNRTMMTSFEELAQSFSTIAQELSSGSMTLNS